MLSGSSDVAAAFATGPSGSTLGLALPLTTAQSVTAGEILYGAVLINMADGPALYMLPNRYLMNVGTSPWQQTIVYANNGNFNVASLPLTIAASSLDFAGYYGTPL